MKTAIDFFKVMLLAEAALVGALLIGGALRMWVEVYKWFIGGA